MITAEQLQADIEAHLAAGNTIEVVPGFTGIAPHRVPTAPAETSSITERRPIPGWEDKYLISRCGQVWSIKFQRPMQQVRYHGVMQVKLNRSETEFKYIDAVAMARKVYGGDTCTTS